MKRTFIAIPVTPSEYLLKILRELQAQLSGEAIKWVEPENLHLTLKFLGNTLEKQLPAIHERLNDISASFRKMNGVLTGLEYFSIKGNPSVLFSKVNDIPGLKEMAEAVDLTLEREGFLPEQRTFRPHLTLARIKTLRNSSKFTGMAGQYRSVEIQPFVAEKMVLYESILRPEGPIYKPLHIYPFTL
jgi:RNA 2',3'-cyclic 3'-phosphodiesterase